MNVPHQLKSFLDDVLLKAVSDIGEGVIVLDVSRIIYSNEAFSKMTGYSGEDLTSLSSFFELVPAENRQLIEKKIASHIEGGKPTGRYEIPIRCHNGVLSHFELTVTTIKDGPSAWLVSIARDITAQRQLQDTLDRQGAQYKLLFQSNPNPMLIYDLDSLLIVAVNDAAVEKYGYSHSEFLTLSLMDIRDPADIPTLLKKVQELREDRSVVKESVKHRKKDGSTMEVEITSHSIDFEGRRARVVMVTDMTDHKKAEKALKESEGKFKELFNNVIDSIFLFTLSDDGIPGKFIEVNNTACAKLGYTREELLRMTPFDVSMPEDAADLTKIFKKLLQQGHLTFEKAQMTKNGLKIPVEINAHVLEWNNQRVVQSISRDITERKRAEETIRRQAYYDVLTNLPNRTLFKDRLEQAMKQAHRNKQMLGVIVLDLDRFKNINETLGHALGDKLLVAVSERLLGALGESETIARFGGDEFTLLLPQVNTVEEATRHAQKIIEILAVPIKINNHELHVTTSIGMAFYPDDGENFEILLKNAETAMYRAKEQGRNNYQLYASVMNVSAFKQLLMENSLRRALDKEEFVVYYQPQIDIKTHKIVGAEALVRWQHPDLGLVFPTEFIGLAEETGLIVPIGEWVIRKVCAQSRKWQDAGYEKVRVSVNLSARQFQQRNLVSTIAQILQDTGLDAHSLGLEITESIAMKNADFTISALNEFKKMGIHLSLDDFGTGYSSLSYLKRFPLEALKIDRSFVRDITTDPNDAAIVTAVVALAHSLKLSVVAEGVETEGQLSYLKNHDCDQVQGYIFSHPLSEENYLRTLRESLK
ncbi:MAG TPA: EAL domain-containing protein [bacterium]|nr:EAL domain-containing protein [bacterium]